MPFVSKITIILEKMLQVFMRTSQLTFSRPFPAQRNFPKGFSLILRMRNIQILMHRRQGRRPRFQIVKSVLS